MTQDNNRPANKLATPHWREIEKRAKPWQQKQRENPYNPETAIGGPPWTGATVYETYNPRLKKEITTPVP